MKEAQAQEQPKAPPQLDQDDQAKLNREELFEMMMQNITQHDKDIYIEALKDLEQDGKKIGEQNVKLLIDAFSEYYDKVVKDDFKTLDHFFKLVMSKKNYITFMLRCASINVFNDLKKDIMNLAGDNQGKFWKFLHDDLDSKFLDLDHDFDTMENSIKYLRELINGKTCEEIINAK